ncbi:efflux RND transporter periplasmic adaptor subunit [Candidatus Falkowbacteria bacterium]|nr:efflux RND transporter periplasmic adaptor subunit [Candidatus Falkowbacteria bacterium]
MTGSIIEESKKERGFSKLLKGKRKIIIFVIVLSVAASGYFYFNKGDNSKIAEVTKKEWTVKKSDLKVSIESDGKVIAEDGVALSFSVTGDTLEVKEVFIKEGDRISKGDKIASVTTEKLNFDLQNAYASYQSSLANLETKQAGPTEEEKDKVKNSIEQAKVSLEQAKITLEQIKSSSQQKINNAEKALATAENNLKLNNNESSEIVDSAYEDLVNSIKSVGVSFGSILQDSDSVLGIDDININDDFELLLGANNSSSLVSAEISYDKVKTEKEKIDFYILNLNTYSNHEEIDTAGNEIEVALSIMQNHLFDMSILLGATTVGPGLTQAELDSFVSTNNSNRSSVSSNATTITNSLQSVRSAKSSLSGYKITYQKAVEDLETAKEQAEQDIMNSENTVKSKELSLEQVEISYRELVAPTRDVDLASLRAQLTSAAINIDKAKYNIAQATLISPIDGEVAMLNYKVGDIINRDDGNAVATIINNDTLFVEVKIEEADINKIKVGQKSYVTFDAVDSLTLDGEISFISLTSSTDNNGIVTYLVRIIINNTGEEKIREGMTAFVDFITAEAKNILIVPVAAVRNVNGKPSVELVSGEWQPVVTGFTDGKNVEIISGLENSDKIVY